MKKILTLLIISASYLQLQAQSSCITALPITVGTYLCDSITGQGPPSSCTGGSLAQNAQWFVYTPTQNVNVKITTDLLVNSGGDTNIGIFTGNCTNLSCFAGDDDGGSIGNGYLSIVYFSALAGTSYYVAIDNKWNASGCTFKLIESPYSLPTISYSKSLLIGSTNFKNDCAVDLNGDYLDDIFTLRNDSTLKIYYQNPLGGFKDTTISIPALTNIPDWSIAAGDLNNSGYNDLVFGGATGVSFLRANSTGTSYTETAFPQYVFSQRSNFIDLNNDGFLDVFVCHDVEPNVYFMNDSTGTLTFHQGGIGDHPQGGYYGSVWVDYDNDGDPDLFIAKCRGGGSTARINEMFRNDGNGVFTNVSVAANMADSVQTWAAAFADYDGDGFMDALVGASSDADGMSKLMHNNGDGTFTDITAGSGWDTDSSLNVEYLTYDFDNDGYPDVLRGGNTMMMNNGDGTFRTMPCGFVPGPCGDFNNDGFIDVLNGNTMYLAISNGNHWSKMSLRGIQSNANGIGGRVEIYGSWGKQIRDVRSGEGFRFMHSLNVHFGLGQATTIDSIHVKWPSGIVDYLFNAPIDSTLHIIEGQHPYPLDTTTNIFDKVKLEEISIYPNPASDRIFIKNTNQLKIKQAIIFATDGRIIRKAKLIDNSISIEGLRPGTYLLQFEINNQASISLPFIKK
ncbi:MAG TPA: FG-GAP-like repeat-containing protein [Edaphocola sp.]|nr:FG-GAP-like repeat-containing protein [Edaphocola sp.]